MFGPEHAALVEEREALAREHKELWAEFKRRTDPADEAEGEMWRTLWRPGGTESRDAWRAASAHRDEMHDRFKDFYRRSNDLSARLKSWRDAEYAKMDAEDAAAGRLPAA